MQHLDSDLQIIVKLGRCVASVRTAALDHRGGRKSCFSSFVGNEDALKYEPQMPHLDQRSSWHINCYDIKR